MPGPTRGETTIVTDDEHPRPGTTVEKLGRLRPLFEGGVVTAGNASGINDGAAALVLMRRSEAEKRGLTPLGIIRGHATHAHEPAWFTTAPGPAISKLLEKVGWKKDEVGLFEINEAFAVVTMAAMRDLDVSHDKVNVHGGACALGHPIGASGTRVLVTLLYEMQKRDAKKGLATLCIGGGMGIAMCLERD